jgi:CheY-like chemotaxis protein
MTHTDARILIIDDDAVSIQILNELLETEGLTPANAPDGKIGMKLHKENPFDLVITDIIMPEMDGLEIIRELRRISPHVKIIAISGGGQLGAEGYLKIADKFGADLTFYKPLEAVEIIEGIRTLLG